VRRRRAGLVPRLQGTGSPPQPAPALTRTGGTARLYPRCAVKDHGTGGSVAHGTFLLACRASALEPHVLEQTLHTKVRATIPTP
jgi:hypothetical protein